MAPLRRYAFQWRALACALVMVAAAVLSPAAHASSLRAASQQRFFGALQGSNSPTAQARAWRRSPPQRMLDGSPWIPSGSPGDMNAAQTCRLNVISLKASSDGSSAGVTPQRALYHLGWYAGLTNVQYCTVPSAEQTEVTNALPAVPTNCRQHEAYQGMLRAASNVPLRDVNRHFLSCSDGRAEYALLGTPGGDILEFIHGLNALEQTIHMPLTPDGIDRLFKEFLQHMLTVGKQYFYMHTDAQAKQAWHTAAGVPDPLNPLDADGRRALLKVAGEAAHVGCTHLRALLEDEQGYHTRKNVTRAAIESFLGVYLDPFNPQRQRLLYVVLNGEPNTEEAIVNVASPETCHPLAPLVVPRLHTVTPTAGGDIRGAGSGEQAGSGSADKSVGSSVAVSHYVAAGLFRNVIAQFLAPKYGINPSTFAAKMNRLAQEFYVKFAQAQLASAPRYAAMYGP